MDAFDVLVIGAGPGGYIAAIRAAQLGMKVACVDASSDARGGPAPGGTCTNVGCIPSKALLQSSEHFHFAQEGLARHGVVCAPPTLDLARMQARREAVIRQNNEGILYLLRKNKVEFVHGRARFTGRSEAGFTLSVEPAGRTLLARQVILASGSVPRALPGVAFDEERILSNEGALSLSEVPRRLGVIGAGVIGLELGSVWRRLGAEVRILEALPDFLPIADEAVAREAMKAFTRQGLAIELGVQIDGVKIRAKGVRVSYRDAQGKACELDCDRLIVSIGRSACTEGLGLEAVGLALDARGAIPVDEHCRSSVPGLWAIGDVVRGPMLAHKAEEEGVAVAESLAGGRGHVDLALVPSVVYTSPEIAWVGRTEAQLKAAGIAYRAGSVPFAANGRARAMGETTGFAKILADAATDEILGVHVIGPLASELIAEAGMAMAFRASSEDIARICHAHPTLSEGLREAALAVDKRTLNF